MSLYNSCTGIALQYLTEKVRENLLSQLVKKSTAGTELR